MHVVFVRKISRHREHFHDDCDVQEIRDEQLAVPQANTIVPLQVLGLSPQLTYSHPHNVCAAGMELLQEEHYVAKELAVGYIADFDVVDSGGHHSDIARSAREVDTEGLLCSVGGVGLYLDVTCKFGEQIINRRRRFAAPPGVAAGAARASR